MFSKMKIALSAAIVLSTAFPASAATKHRRVTHVHQGYRFITWSPTPWWRLFANSSPTLQQHLHGVWPLWTTR